MNPNMQMTKIEFVVFGKRANLCLYSKGQARIATLPSFCEDFTPLDWSDSGLYLHLTKIFPKLTFHSLDQIHSTIIHNSTEFRRKQGFLCHHGEGDGLFTKEPFQALCIRTADCIPVVLYSDEAIACLHAGWRGLVEGILQEFEKNCLPFFSSSPGLWIGDHIHGCCFEIQKDVLPGFLNFKFCTPQDICEIKNSHPINSWEKFEKNAILQNEASTWKIAMQPMIERWHQNLFQSPELLPGPSLCTVCNRNLHSWRRDRCSHRTLHIAWLESQ